MINMTDREIIDVQTCRKNIISSTLGLLVAAVNEMGSDDLKRDMGEILEQMEAKLKKHYLKY